MKTMLRSDSVFDLCAGVGVGIYLLTYYALVLWPISMSSNAPT